VNIIRVEQIMGDRTTFSVRHRLLNSILFLGVLLSFLGAAANYMLNFPLTAIIPTFISGSYLAGLYYLSRFCRHYNLQIFAALFLTMLIVPVAWLNTGGSLSRAPLYIVLFVPMVSILLDDRNRNLAILLILALVNGLIYWEYLHPQAIHLPLHSATRYWDLGLSLTLTIIASSMVFSKVFGYYQEEFQRANFFLETSQQAQTHLRYISYHDKLTNTYNRAYFEEELLRLEQGKTQQVGVFFFDVDGLKFVNDTLGHEQGDRLLVRAVEILNSAFETTEPIFRIGGDEFVILMQQVQKDTLESLYAKLDQALKTANRQCREKEMPLHLSFGFALGQNRVLRDLLKDAEGKMYREKLLHHADDNWTIMQTVKQMLSARDFDTGEHSERLELLLCELAQRAGMAGSSLADLRLFARFHDIGKVGIPDHILLKPGALSTEEWQTLKKHSEIGYRIAYSSHELRPIANWILKHHEHWNGLGYPLGLAGQDIPFECRLLAIVDSYDAMISDRPYRQGMPHQAALQELERCAGSQFDPDLTRLFLEMIHRKESATDC
jgi:diguanylate cyclase (GGDEF)-like protein